MVNESSKGKSLLFFLLLVAFFQSNLLNATPHFNSVRSVGLLTEQAYMEASPEERPSNRASFFGTLGPEISEKGAVKTFKVRVVSRPALTEDWIRPGRASESSKDKLEPVSKTFARPVSGQISSLFGNRRHPRTHAVRFHSGLDISAPRGTPVGSSLSGKVTFAGWRRGYGLVVVINHGNNLETVYAHCSKLAVKVGQNVNTGQRLGSVGNTGVATGSHLHFEVRRSGNVRNPLRYLSY